MNKKASSFDKNLLTPTEAANRLMVSPITLRKWAEKGLIQTLVTLGGHRRYPLSEVERLLQRRGPSSDAPLKIMIVDDDLLLSSLLQDFLTSLNIPVMVEMANDGFEAGRRFSIFKPNIILLDLMMPGMDGFEVCRRIKSEPANAQIRVIAMTSFPSKENVRQILAAGAEACLPKPVENEELIAALRLPEYGLALK